MPSEFQSGCDSSKPPASDVPVFDCHALLAGPDANGRYQARAANLPGVVGSGQTERQAMLSLVTAFKAIVADHRRNAEPIPWKQPSETPKDGEVERWISVHL